MDILIVVLLFLILLGVIIFGWRVWAQGDGAGAANQMDARLDTSDRERQQGFNSIIERLAVIDSARKNLDDLSQNITGLQNILSNKQARGAFGETVMEDLIKDLLPDTAFSLKPTLSNNRRPDCLLHLENPPGPMAVDSKFPLESWKELSTASDDAARKIARKKFEQDVLSHISDIQAKYIIPGETAESAIMFLPSEAIFAELHTSFQHLIEKSFKARVWIVSPATMMAVLTTLRSVLKDVRMRKQAGLIQMEVGKLAKDVRLLIDASGKLARHFDQAREDMNSIAMRSERIEKRAENIQDVNVDEEGA